jgi:Ethylbenzene dehydrogenase
MLRFAIEERVPLRDYFLTSIKKQGFMKNRKMWIIIALVIFPVTLLTFCTKKNQVLDASSTTTPVLLSSIKGTATLQPTGGSAWDGVIESVWNNAPKLAVHAVVPDLGNNTFTGFIGNATDVTVRSMYDATNIYFLVEWNTNQKNVASAPWYYNPGTRLWAQESGVPVMNADSESFRPAFIQDQFVIMFNIANSMPSFNTLSCYATCHANSSFGGVTAPEGGAMRTNGPTEYLDCWRARMLQVVNVNQANDTYLDWGNGTLNQNEVHNDLQAKTSDGGFSNKKTLTITGTSTKEAVPAWVIPAGSYSNGAILQSDTLAGGKAVKVIAVDTNGILTLANSTTIDPRTVTSATDYQQIGAGDGPKCIPGSIVAPYSGSRGDVTANAFFTGTGWRLLLKRALNTTDAKYDVDFSSLDDQYFGLGVMFNGADNEHAIVNGLKLHFNK